MGQYPKYTNIASLLLVIGAVFFYSCKNRSIQEWEEYSESTKPELVGKNVEIIQSRNGKVQFKVTMPTVIEIQKDNAPYSYICPNGVTIWQYDSLRNAAVKLVADSAYVIEPEQYYELWNNVIITQESDSSKAIAQKIIIDRKKNRIHSDTTIYIVKFRNISNAKADGFESDLGFNKIRYYNQTQGLIDYKDLKMNRTTDTLKSDSIKSSIMERQ